MLLDYAAFYKMNMPCSTTEEMLEQNKSIERGKAQYALNETKERLKKASKKQEEIDNLNYEKGLILNNVFALIKEDIHESYFNIFRYCKVNELMYKAWKYAYFKDSHRLNDLKKAHKEDPKYNPSLNDYKETFEFVVKTVKNRLIPEQYREDSTLIELLDFNYSTAYEFTFKCKGVEYTISVPVFLNVNNNNFLEILNGYTLRFQESEHCIGFAFSAINPEEFMESLEKWLDERIPEHKVEEEHESKD